MNDFNLKDFLSRFHSQSKAGIITNKHGIIIEANALAAELLNVRSNLIMKNAPLVSFVHRNGSFDFKVLLSDVIKYDCSQSDSIKFRPRSKCAFRAQINGRVIARTNAILLIDWSLVDAELMPSIPIPKEICSDEDEDFEEYMSV